MLFYLKQKLFDGLSATSDFIVSLDRQQWIFILVAITVAGFLCLRGIGGGKTTF